MTYRIPSPTLKDIQATADTKTSRNATYREGGDLLLLQIAGNNTDAHPLHCCSYMYRLALYPGFLSPSSTHSFAEGKPGIFPMEDGTTTRFKGNSTTEHSLCALLL